MTGRGTGRGTGWGTGDVMGGVMNMDMDREGTKISPITKVTMFIWQGYLSS